MGGEEDTPGSGNSLQPKLPFDFTVVGTALTFSAASVPTWKARVEAAARAALPEGAWLLTDPLAVTIYIFPRAEMQGDLDNRIKPILDAMTRCVYDDDKIVERIVAQKFEPGRYFAFESPTDVLLSALESEEPIVYIRVSGDLHEELSGG